jgi:hypothetical protein
VRFFIAAFTFIVGFLSFLRVGIVSCVHHVLYICYEIRSILLQYIE